MTNWHGTDPFTKTNIEQDGEQCGRIFGSSNASGAIG